MTKAPQDIDQILEVISKTVGGGSDLWPLKPSQLFPYFDMDQCLDLNAKIKDLDKRGVTKESVAETIQHPSVIRGLIVNVLGTGLKVANKLEVGSVTEKDQVELFQYFLDLLKIDTPEDPFCVNGTNYFIKPDEVNKHVRNLIWLDAVGSNISAVNSLNVALIAYAWAFYWSYFPFIGYETYGPYNVETKFGKGSRLLIKDYYNLTPEEVWPIAKNSPVKTIRIYQVFKTEDIKLSFGNRVLSNTNLPSVSSSFAVEVDGSQLLKTSELETIASKLTAVAQEQTNYVNSLSDLDKVRKGAELSNFSLKNFYTTFFGEWNNTGLIEQSIKTLGDKFIKSGTNQRDRTQEEMVKMFDPRNSFLP